MNYTYNIKQDFHETNNSQLVAVYGMEALNEHGEVTEAISDISCDKSEMLALIQKCNKHQLDPIQMRDIVEDFINS